MRISLSKICQVSLAVVLCLTSCLGSLYYLLSGYMQLLLTFVLFVSLMIPVIKEKRIGFNLQHAILYFMMVFIIVYRNPQLQSFAIRVVLLTITMQLYIWLSKFQYDDWIKNTFLLCKGFYLFYALYTIGEKFNHNLFLLSTYLFKSSYENLYMQYSRNCMPGLTNHYSTNGMLLGVGIVLFGSEMIKTPKFKNYLYFGIMLIALLLTGKRSDILFSAIGLYLAFYCYMSNKKNKRKMTTLAIIFLAGIGLFIVANYIPSLATFITRFEETSENGDVTLGRTKMWAIAIDCFKENPIIGIGWGRFMYRNLHEWNAHNIYVQLMAETGCIGFAIYVYFFVSMLWKSWQHLKYIRINKCSLINEEKHLIFAIAMQIFFLLYGFTGNPLYDKEAYVPYYIACAITMFYVSKKRDINNM